MLLIFNVNVYRGIIRWCYVDAFNMCYRFDAFIHLNVLNCSTCNTELRNSSTTRSVGAAESHA